MQPNKRHSISTSFLDQYQYPTSSPTCRSNSDFFLCFSCSKSLRLTIDIFTVFLVIGWLTSDKCQVKPINVSTTCKMKILCCVEMFLAITICHQIGHGRRLMPRIKTNSTLKYSKFAYSVFSVRQFTTDNSTLVFQFKTLKKHGMLFYMDDEGANFIDAFLLRGQLRIRLTIGSCKGKQFINGSFTDLEWHRIILKRTPETVLLTVDNRNASSFKICNRVGETSFKKLYVSSFPFEEWLQPIKWMFRDSWELSLKHGG